MFRIWSLIAVVLTFGTVETALGIDEYFYVENRCAHPILVVLNSTGTNPPTKWRFSVVPYGVVRTKLTVPQPYDITVWLNEDEAYVFTQQRLCDFMKECRSLRRQGLIYGSITKPMSADLWSRPKDNRKVMVYGGKMGTFNPDIADRHVYLVFESLAPALSPVATAPIDPAKPYKPRFDLETAQGTPAVGEVTKRKKRLFDSQEGSKPSPHRFEP